MSCPAQAISQLWTEKKVRPLRITRLTYPAGQPIGNATQGNMGKQEPSLAEWVTKANKDKAMKNLREGMSIVNNSTNHFFAGSPPATWPKNGTIGMCNTITQLENVMTSMVIQRYENGALSSFELPDSITSMMTRAAYRNGWQVPMPFELSTISMLGPHKKR
jgi:hypothetical protein